MEEFQIELPNNLENLYLPSPELTNYWRLAENRIFYIDFEIDESILEIQRNIIYINLVDKDIKPEDRTPIKILIDSPGGLLSETMSLAATITMSKTPVITINMATAYSGGAILLLAGHKRYAMPYSKVMIHTGQGSTCGTYEQTMEQQKNYKRQVDDMSAFILKQSGMDEKVYKKNKSKEWYFMPEDALKYHIVDEIIENIFDIL